VFAQQAREFLLTIGYRQEDLLEQYRYTWRADDGRLRNETADLVAFASAPHDLRCACISVIGGDTPEPIDVLSRLRFLTTPLVLSSVQETINLWSLRPDREPSLVHSVQGPDWARGLRAQPFELGPQSILEAKRGQRQLSFVDAGLLEWGERITEQALTNLLESLVSDALRGRGTITSGNERALLRLVFQLFACRVLEDKGVIATLPTPAESLEAAHQLFPENINPSILRATGVTRALVERLSSALRERFAFASLTTQMLGYAYENALVTPALRRKHGIFYTPRSITSYVLERLPVESIAQSDRALLDPCCGSGSFLLAGFERLTGLLPATFSPAQRHQYLRRALRGADIDPFALEIAALSLVLADGQNRNGWELLQQDVLNVTVDAQSRRPSIVVTNPPFREVKHGGVRKETAAEVLLRLLDLLRPNGLMGIVLPQSILDSRSATVARRALLDRAQLLEIATLTGGLFGSSADTAVMIVRKHGTSKTAARLVTVRELRSKDLSKFRLSGAFSATYSVDPLPWKQDAAACFVLSPIAETWSAIEERCRRLHEVAIVRNGLRVQADDNESVTADTRPGAVPFVDRLDVLRPFALLIGKGLKDHKWLRYGTHLDRPRDASLFKSTKVLLNSNRNTGSRWRLVAAIAAKGLYFSDNFHAVLPLSDGPSLEHIVAVLNSPVANAWFDAHCKKRKVVQATLEQLPFPTFDEKAGTKLNELVRQLERGLVAQWRRNVEGLFYDGSMETGDTARLLSEVDEIIYAAYGLGRFQRQTIDKLMSVDPRPT